MLKAGRSSLFTLLYLCTCRYHALTKYMATSHSSLCKPFAHTWKDDGVVFGPHKAQLKQKLCFVFSAQLRTYLSMSSSSSFCAQKIKLKAAHLNTESRCSSLPIFTEYFRMFYLQMVVCAQRFGQKHDSSVAQLLLHNSLVTIICADRDHLHNCFHLSV